MCVAGLRPEVEVWILYVFMVCSADSYVSLLSFTDDLPKHVDYYLLKTIIIFRGHGESLILV